MADISAVISDVPLWNRSWLAPPPEVFLDYSESELTAVLPLCAGVSADLGSQLATSLRALLNELHLLRSIAYRVGNQFSNCRAFRGVRAVTRCGRRLRLAVDPEWLSLRAAALARPQRRSTGGGSLPSRQLAQHLLVVCQRAGRLLGRLAGLAEHAAQLWLQWLRLGHQAQLAVAFLGLLGRVWSLARTGRAGLCRLYSAVLPLEGRLRETAVPWPHDPLPACLWDWLGLPVGEGEDEARGSLHTARRRHDELPFEDQSREITVSLLPTGGGGCLDQTFSAADGSKTGSERQAGECDSDLGNGGGPVPMEDLGDPLSESDEEMAPVEDLGEVVDGDQTFTIVPVSENGGAIHTDWTARHSADESDDQLADENCTGQVNGAQLQRDPETPTSPRVSAGDRKLYRRVNKLTRQWNSREDLMMFVKQESEARKLERKQCVTARLSNAQWKRVKQGLKEQRVKWRKCEKRDDQLGVEKAAKRSKLLVKTWSLFPSSEGKKPEDWSHFLERVKNKRLSP